MPRPYSGRTRKRSVARPMAPTTSGVSTRLNQKLPVRPRKYSPMKAPTMKNAPWAKFTTVSMPKIRLKPMASSAYTAPSAMPVTSCRASSEGVISIGRRRSGRHLVAHLLAGAEILLVGGLDREHVEDVVLVLHALALALDDHHALHRLVV